ncbi:hypothetical protein KUTeg_003154 [Tegillarca granosa]|uniref:Cadherin domain-containing protein n=1 Tax=Tegillarca granosa TaxID=220873 RepID=A0ABQ9FLB4_TEGGR|nr:hypothetical protein KUTeg_003154 [Tegillarca granosa]
MGWPGMEPTTFILLLLWIVTVSGQTPCSSIDFITNQELPSVTIYEADNTAVNPLLYFTLESSDVNNQNNGVYITLSQPLDRDTQYTLPVIIADLNDNTPVFTSASYTDNVNEKLVVGTSLDVKVTATDADAAQNQNIQFAIVSQELTGTISSIFQRTTDLDFAITSQVENGRTVGTLSVARDLDYELLAANGSTTYRLNITATSGQLTMFPNPAIVPTQQAVTIQAKDRDTLNAAIAFDIVKFVTTNSGSMIGQISELATPGTLVDSTQGQKLRLEISDQDILNGDPEQTYLYTTNTNIFSVTQDRFISLTSSNLLDYETDRDIIFTVVVREGTTTQRRSATVTLTINVLDGNDNPPVFPAQAYSQNVPAGAYSGFSPLNVIQVTATDQDSGTFGFITYSLLSSVDQLGNNVLSRFQIDSAGRITARSTLTAGELITITVQAADGGQGSQQKFGRTVVLVNVTGTLVNQGPSFAATTYNIIVSEGVEIGASVFTAPAVDPEGNALSFTISDLSNTQFQFQDFEINSTTGIVNTRRRLDRESRPTYALLIFARETSTTRSATTTLSITLSDINDNRPVFTNTQQNNNYFFSVNEGQTGVTVGTVTAVDGDSIQNVQYVLVGTDSSDFSIQQNGLITANIAFDFETKSSYQFSVTTTDGRNTNALSASAIVTVTVVDRNDFTPQILVTPAGTIDKPETTVVGDQIADFDATDNDTPNTDNSRLSFAITGVSPISGNNLFYVNPNDGRLYLVQSFLSDTNRPTQYTVRVVATDGGGLTAEATVFISVNRNLNTPEWLLTTYSTTIVENYPLSQSILQLSARDQDLLSPHNQLAYTIEGDSLAQSYFGVSDTGYIFLTQSPASLQQVNSFSLTIRLQDKGSPVRTANDRASVTVNIQRNQNPPIFFNTSYFSVIREDVNVGTSVVTVTATDADTNVRVLAVDNGSPSRSAVAIVYVTIQRNFFPPVFQQPSYAYQVSETQALGVEIGRVRATDSDTQAPHNQVRYELLTTTDYFVVDGISGVISVKKPLYADTTKPNNYVLSVRAFDQGSPVLTATANVPVNINVVRNNNPPVFINTPYARSISKDTQIGSSIFRVTATDADNSQFSQITYALVGVDPAPTFFSLNSNTGEITVRPGLASDSRTTYTTSSAVEYSASGATQYFFINPTTGAVSVQKPLTDDTSLNNNIYQVVVALSDGAGRSAPQSATVTINVLRNNLTPYFVSEPYSRLITETVLQGTSIYQVTARDDDQIFNQVRYEVIGDGNAPSFFEVNAVTGSISLRQTLTSQADTVYSLRIRAYDNGIPAKSNTSVVTLTVNRNLNSPRFTQTSWGANVPDNQPLGETIITVTATDADTVNPYNVVRYQLKGDANSPALTYFFISPETGAISLRRALSLDQSQTSFYQAPFNTVTTKLIGDDTGPQYFNYDTVTGAVSVRQDLRLDTNTFYRLRIEAKDGGTPALSATALVEITVQRNLFTPSFTNLTYETTILETQAIGTTVIRLVTATDLGSPALTSVPVTVVINIRRNRFPPVFQNEPYSRALGANVQIGTSVVTVTATDADTFSPFNVVSYSIIGDDNAQNLFSVAGNGVITLTSSINTDSNNVYRLRLLARDGGYPSLTATAILNITVQRNLFPPVFSHSDITVTIPETASIGSFIADTNATDADTEAPNNVIRYSAIGDADAPNYFYVNPIDGRVTLLNSVLNTGRSGYSIIISRTTETLGFILPAYTNRISENLAVGQPVTTVTAQPQPDIVYDIIGFSDGPDYFNISSVTGSIFVRQDLRLDLNKKTLYYFTVKARDQSSPEKSSFATVIVNVRRSSFPPVFIRTPYQANVDTNTAVGTQFYTVTATDSDLLITVSVTDNGIPPRVCTFPAQVTIQVLRNQFDPFFLNEPYVTTIPETTNIGVNVLQVTARDQDTGTSFNNITYQLIGDDTMPSYFALNTLTGQITVRSVLTAETRDSYQGRIVAFDSGSPPRSATATAKIFITRNLNKPVFNPTNYAETILETLSIGTSILRVTATDADRIDINNVASSTYFQVNPSSGWITVRVPLTQDNLFTNQFRFNVYGTDQGSPNQISDIPASVTINIIRNQNPPVFVQEPYSTSISFTVPSNTFVYDVNATDADTRAVVNLRDAGTPVRSAVRDAFVTINIIRNQNTPYFINEPYRTTPFGQIVYDIIGDDEAPLLFRINSVTGRISIASSLNQQSTEEYRIRVQARDQGVPFRYNTSVVIVTLQRNFQSPIFTRQEYTQTIVETLPLGNVILTVNATDGDPLSPFNLVRYSIIGDDAATTYFRINETTGLISLMSGINLDTQSTYKSPQNQIVYTATGDSLAMEYFQISAADGVVSVKKSLLENRNINSFTGVFNTITYDLIGDDNAPVYFRIDPNTGLVYLQSNLFADTATTYKLRVRARDGGSPSCERYQVLSIFVRRNEFAPTWNGGVNNFETTILETHDVLTPVYTVSATDRDISIRVRVRDGGNPNLADVTTVQVTVTRNLFPPVFSPQQYSRTISDTESIGYPLLRLTANDADTTAPFNTIRYSLIGDDETPTFFEVDSVTGLIRTRANVDLTTDSASRYVARVLAYDGGFPSRSATATVQINVLRNLHSPIFSNIDFIRLTIPETTPIGPTYFRVNPSLGQILVNSDLKSDPARLTFYQFTVVASDQRIPERTATATVFINILRDRFPPVFIREPYDTADVTISVTRNENAPIFSLPSYERTISDTFALGRVLVDVNATDADGDILKYEIVGDSRALEYYYINPDTGEISLKKYLTEGTQTSDLRTAAVNSSVLQTSAVDQDLRDVIRYTLSGDNNDNNFFYVNPDSGLISLKRSLTSAVINQFTGSIVYGVIGDLQTPFYFDVDSSSGVVTIKNSLRADIGVSYVLRVTAYDSASPSRVATSSVLITVTRNPSPPAFLQPNYRTTIANTYSLGRVVVNVTAVDPDGDVVRYQLLNNVNNNNLALDYFFIEGESGLIYLKKPLTDDPLKTAQFQLRVRAYDSVFPTDITTATVAISISRNENAPRFLSNEYRVTINETISVGTCILNTTAVDADGDTVIYRAALFNNENDTLFYFYVSVDSGFICVQQPLTGPTKTEYRMQVLARDQGNPERTGLVNVIITVLRDNFPPFFLNTPYSTSIPERTAVSTSIFQVSASDRDLVARVIAYDDVRPNTRATAVVQILVFRNPNGPVWSLPSYSTIINENRQIGSVVLNVSATDADIGDVVTYSIIGQQPTNVQYFFIDQFTGAIWLRESLVSTNLFSITDTILYSITGDSLAQEYFYINPRTGIISLKKSVAPINVVRFTLRVIGYDTAYPSNQATTDVFISVTRNQFGPEFRPSATYETTIPDTTPIGNVVLNVLAIDQDQNGEIRYNTIGYFPATEYFRLNQFTGEIQQIQSISNDQYNSLLYVEDVFIDVVRNPNSPVFFPAFYAQEIPETLPVGTEVLTVTATDQDNDVLAYEIDETQTFNEARQFFFMTTSNGKIYVRSNLANAPRNSYTFTVRARDRSYPEKFGTANVQITIRRDQFTPTFTLPSYSRTIPETEAVNGTFPIVTVTATDQDLRGSLVYEATGDGSALSYFYITRDGRVYLKNSLRQDSLNQYTLRVVAYDTFYPNNRGSSVVLINIIRNPSGPIFTLQNYEETINDNFPVGNVVLTVTATDADGLRVAAYDSLVSNQITTATVIIGVTRNDNPPIFQNEPYRVNVPESFAIGTSLIQITATDLDGDRIRYSIFGQSNENFGYFYLNPDTGIFYLTRSLTTANFDSFSGRIAYEAIGVYPARSFFGVDNIDGSVRIISSLKGDGLYLTSYTLKVIAYDTQSRAQVATADVSITVSRNVNPPIFTQSRYQTTISESYAFGVPVIKVSATDRDNDAITYSMLRDNTNGQSLDYFFIEQVDGNIYLRKSLTSSTTSQFSLRIRAYDSNNKLQYDDEDLLINVNRNINPPRFVERTYDRLTYSLSSDSNCIRAFYIGSDDGVLRLRISMLNTADMSFTCRVTVSDNGYPQAKTDAVNVLISVNRDLNLPVFTNNARYSVVIDESTPVTRNIIQVQATRLNMVGRIYYEAIGDYPAQSFFGVQNVSGQVSVQANLRNDNLRLNSYVLNVLASDNVSPSPKIASATVFVNVLRDLASPRFTNLPDRVNVFENQAVNRSIYTATATDADLKGRIVYELTGLFPTQSFFTVDSNSGAVILRNSLLSDSVSTQEYTGSIRYRLDGYNPGTDYFFVDTNTGDIYVRRTLTQIVGSNLYTTFTLLVTAYDSGAPEATTSEIVTLVINRNLNAPRFGLPRYEATIYDYLPVGSSVVQLNATDVDTTSPENTINFAITDTTGYFVVHPFNGMITVNKLLTGDINRQNSYQFSARVSDFGRPILTGDATVLINVIRNNAQPIFTNGGVYDVTVSEGKPVLENIVQVSATDTDDSNSLNGQIMYSITGPALRVTASDRGIPVKSAEATVTIRITRLVYDITGEGLAVNLFTINANTGLITLAQSFQSDDGVSYIIRVEAYRQSDSTKRASTKVRVNVRRNTARPNFAHGNLEITILENQAIGVQIINVNATDSDTGENGRITYTIRGSDSVPTYSTSYFYVNPETGIVYVTKALTDDNQRPTRYVLSIVATDNGYPRLSGQVTLTVNVIHNRNGPIFTSDNYADTIDENFRIGNSILQVRANDADGITVQAEDRPGQQVSPRIATSLVTITVTRNPNGPIFTQSTYNITISEYIAVQTRIISVTANDQDSPGLIVRARDSAQSPKSATATVYINIVRNINEPIFTSPEYATTVFDAYAVGTSLFVVTAVDADRNVPLNRDTPNAEFDYIVDPDYPYAATFFDVTKDGTVYVRKSLTNADQRSTFQFYIIAIDRSWKPLSSRALVKINVTYTSIEPVNVGFISPSFEAETIENLNANTRVLLAEVRNHDFDTLLVCTIISVTPASGVAYYTYNRVNVTVYVRDANDNKPVWTYPVYPAGVPAVYVSAVSIDAAAGSRVVMSTVGGTGMVDMRNATNKIVLIESVKAGRLLAADKILGYDETRTDVQFVVADQLQGYILLEKDGTDYLTTNSATSQAILNAIKRDLPNSSGVAVKVRAAYTADNIQGVVDALGGSNIVRLKSKSYIWWTDNPWAALVALAAIIILLCLVAIIILFFSWNSLILIMN